MGQLTVRDEFANQLAKEGVNLRKMLPKHIDAEHFERAAMMAVDNNPKLLQADRTSLFNSLQRCAGDGLMPDNREAAILDFNTKVNNEFVIKAQYMPMVDGVLKRARQSGVVKVITARCVYENDDFDYWIDEGGEHLTHRPKLRGDRGKMEMAYAMVTLTSGDMMVEPMTLDELEKVRKASKTPDNGPWVNWYERMCEKSALHRLTKRIPNSSEIMEMLDKGNFMYDFDNNNDAEPERDVSPDATPEPENTKPPYPQESFDTNFPKWRDLIDSGKKSAERVISTIQTKNSLTEEQKTQIRNCEAIEGETVDQEE